MKKIALIIGSTLLCLSTAYSAIPNQGDPTPFIGPTLKGRYSSFINDTSAYSLLGEAGLKNVRVGGTLGWRLADNHRAKLSAEWLEQKLIYTFFSGDADQWVNQWAIGVGYQYDFADYSYQSTFDLNLDYSHAPSKTLSTVTGVFTNSHGQLRTFTDQRRIAGSNAGSISPGISFTPWIDGRAGIELNYDNVQYDKIFSPSRHAKGFGGTIRLDQGLSENTTLGLSAAVRQPYNNYTLSVDRSNISYFGTIWTMSIDAAYTIGKTSLPNSWNVSVGFDYLLQPCPMAVPIQYDHPNFKGEYIVDPMPVPVKDPFWSWMAKPAVYRPQVLAIIDEHVTTDPVCPIGSAPLATGTIPSQIFEVPSISTVPTAQVFTGPNLVFSVTTSPAPTGGNSVTIDPATGVVTVNAVFAPDLFDVTVTATNKCGSANTTFSVEISLD